MTFSARLGFQFSTITKSALLAVVLLGSHVYYSIIASTLQSFSFNLGRMMQSDMYL